MLHTNNEPGLIPSPQNRKNVLVVGAGVAGLQVARQLLKLSTCQVLVLEANNDIGGVWMENYVGYSLQVPWRMYQFPEFLWPPELQPQQEYPSGAQVQAYVRAYAAHFGLMPYIRLNCKLLRLSWAPASRTWEALYCDTGRQKFYKVTVDYVVMCSGIYSTPFIPSYTGSASFAGLQLHAKDFTDMTVVAGRRVLIVGSGKTALDCVCGVVASREASAVTMLYRQAHWPVPRTILGVSIRRLLFNRAMAGMLPPYYTATRLERAAGAAMKPLRRLFWKGMECLVAHKFQLTDRLKPHVQLPTDLFYGGQILDDRVDDHLEAYSLETVRGEINSFVRNGVILQDGSFRAADVVLYCTGYDKSYEYLDGATRSRLGIQKDGLYLYRSCLAPGVPHLAFVGSEVSTYNNILTHGLQALWLAHVLSGKVALPSSAEMAADIREQQRWRRKVMPSQRNRGAVLMLYMMYYHDQLLRDMGHSPRRKGLLNPLAECFGAYSAEDYTPLMRFSPMVPTEPVDTQTRAQRKLVTNTTPRRRLQRTTSADACVGRDSPGSGNAGREEVVVSPQSCHALAPHRQPDASSLSHARPLAGSAAPDPGSMAPHPGRQDSVPGRCSSPPESTPQTRLQQPGPQPHPSLSPQQLRKPHQKPQKGSTRLLLPGSAASSPGPAAAATVGLELTAVAERQPSLACRNCSSNGVASHTDTGGGLPFGAGGWLSSAQGPSTWAAAANGSYGPRQSSGSSQPGLLLSLKRTGSTSRLSRVVFGETGLDVVGRPAPRSAVQPQRLDEAVQQAAPARSCRRSAAGWTMLGGDVGGGGGDGGRAGGTAVTRTPSMSGGSGGGPRSGTRRPVMLSMGAEALRAADLTLGEATATGRGPPEGSVGTVDAHPAALSALGLPRNAVGASQVPESANTTAEASWSGPRFDPVADRIRCSSYSVSVRAVSCCSSKVNSGFEDGGRVGGDDALTRVTDLLAKAAGLGSSLVQLAPPRAPSFSVVETTGS